MQGFAGFFSWEKTGEFKLPEYAYHGMIECPCLVKDAKDVLMMSMDVPDSEFSKFPKEAIPHNRLMQYFIGHFDGKTFVVDESRTEALLFDYGPDFYAGTIFSNIEDNILIAWLGDFSDNAKNAPTVREGFKGILSFPRIIKLKKCGGKYLLHHSFVKIPDKNEAMYECDGEIETLTDGCIIENVTNGGFIVKTSYRD